MDGRQLNAIIGYLSRSLSAAALMIWGVFNISALVFQYMSRTGDDGNWIASYLMCGFFGAVPFLLGSWLLYQNVIRTSGSQNRSTRTG